jgi:inhibitor of cysteine peptidase
MKRSLVVAIFAVAAFAVPAIAGTLSGDVFSDPSQTIAATKGSEFLIALPSNPTTGYSWTVRVAGAAVESEGSAYQRRPVAPGVAGAGGQQIFALEAEARGSATLTFSYARPWEKGKAAAKTAVFHVTVK